MGKNCDGTDFKMGVAATLPELSEWTLSPTKATRIRTYGQSSSVACFDQHSDEKPKVEMKTKSNCAPDGSLKLANGFSE